jgi:polygalacturonase
MSIELSPVLRCAAIFLLANAGAGAATFNIASFGARGDGTTQNGPAIERAIQAATAAGGGTVEIPAGIWVTGSVHLRSHITLQLERGAVVEASSRPSAYDAPEPNPWDQFQDFGHSHFHNSLIWGENLEDIAILGGGRISGAALTRDDKPLGGDKAIALKLCRNVTLRDFSIANGGHFGILATGVDNLTMDNLTIDTNRDGIDLDSCRNVRIANSSVNSPTDDAITLKGTHALGQARTSENITITNSLVSGFSLGSLLAGTFRRDVQKPTDHDGPTGRIKIGTESEGDFRNITISNIVFDTSRGLALESVDGSHIEDVAISNITMHNVSSSPFFIRLGSRLRAPEGVQVGSIKRISISNVTVYDADARYASIISGIPGHDVENVTLRGIRIVDRGGLNFEPAGRQPYDIPEREKEYPEPSMFGISPAHGFFVRHAKQIEFQNVDVNSMQADGRPAFVVQDVQGVYFNECRTAGAKGAPRLVIIRASDVNVSNCAGLADFHGGAQHKEL